MATKEIKLNEVGYSVSLKHYDIGNLTDVILKHIADNCGVYEPYDCEKCPLGTDRKPISIGAELRKKYDRKQCIHYPVLIEDGHVGLVDEGKNNAYIIVNKRDLRMSKSCYRFIPAADISELAYNTVQAIITEMNNILNYGVFGCRVELTDDGEEKTQTIAEIVAGSPKELAERVIDKLEYLETTLDGLIEQAAGDMWKTLNFN